MNFRRFVSTAELQLQRLSHAPQYFCCVPAADVAVDPRQPNLALLFTLMSSQGLSMLVDIGRVAAEEAAASSPQLAACSPPSNAHAPPHGWPAHSPSSPAPSTASSPPSSAGAMHRQQQRYELTELCLLSVVAPGYASVHRWLAPPLSARAGVSELPFLPAETQRPLSAGQGTLQPQLMVSAGGSRLESSFVQRVEAARDAFAAAQAQRTESDRQTRDRLKQELDGMARLEPPEASPAAKGGARAPSPVLLEQNDVESAAGEGDEMATPRMREWSYSEALQSVVDGDKAPHAAAELVVATVAAALPEPRSAGDVLGKLTKDKVVVKAKEMSQKVHANSAESILEYKLQIHIRLLCATAYSGTDAAVDPMPKKPLKAINSLLGPLKCVGWGCCCLIMPHCPPLTTLAYHPCLSAGSTLAWATRTALCTTGWRKI